MEKGIDVSIIIPVYNVENYLEECIESALNQTLNNIEVIAVNDGSTDGSLDILEEYEMKYDNLKVINQANKGLSVARNVGLKHAKGKYVYFLDSDDYIDSKLAETCYYICERNKAQVAMFDAGVLYENGLSKNDFSFDYDRKNKLEANVIKKGEELFCELNEKNCYRSPVWLFFYERAFLEYNNLSFYSGIIHEDELFTPKVLLKTDRVVYIPKNLIFRRVRNNSIMTTKLGIKNIEGYYTVAEELYKFSKSIEDGIKKITYKILVDKIISLYTTSYRACFILSNNNKRDDLLMSRIKKSVLEKKDLNSIKLKVLIMFPSISFIISNIKKILRAMLMKVGRGNA